MTTNLTPTPAGIAEPKPRSKARTLVVTAIMFVTVVVASYFIGPAVLPSTMVWVARAVVFTLIAASSVSIVCWRKLAVKLGPITSFAALAIIWGAALALLMLSMPSCPGAEGAQRCSATEVISYGAIGMLFVVSVAAFIVPPMMFGKAGKATYRWNRRRVTSRIAKDAKAANSKRNKHGVSSKAHEKNQDKSAFRQGPNAKVAASEKTTTGTDTATPDTTVAAKTKRKRKSGSGKLIVE